MGYVEHILQPGEEIKHVSRLTWIIYLPGIAWLIVGLIGLMLLPPGQTLLFLNVIVAIAVVIGVADLDGAGRGGEISRDGVAGDVGVA